jgi:uncharacterized membrane protein YccC
LRESNPSRLSIYVPRNRAEIHQNLLRLTFFRKTGTFTRTEPFDNKTETFVNAYPDNMPPGIGTPSEPPAPAVSSPPIARAPDVWRGLWQSVIRFQKEKITPWIALRNTVGFVVPLAAGISLGAVPVAIALATGALNVSYSDSHDPYLLRWRKMLAASLLCGFAVFAGALCGRNYVIAPLAAGLWAFAAGLIVCLSTTAADLGVISLVTLIVYSAVPQTPARAVYAGLLAVVGGLFQTLLSIAFWPLRRYVAERRALGGLYLELSRSADAPVEVLQAPPASGPISQAQSTLTSLNLDHSVEAERYRSLLNQAERIRLSLLVLGRLRIRLARERVDGLEADLLEAYFASAARILLALGNALASTETIAIATDRLQELDQLAEELRDLKPESPLAEALTRDARVQMDALAGQLRSAVDLASHVSPDGENAFQKRELQKPWRLRVEGIFATLRANFHLGSTAYRHALRMAVCVAVGDLIGRSYGLRRSYWLPMTIAIVLKPDFTTTFSRGVLREIGTMLGLVLSTALFHLLDPSMAAEVLLLGAFMFALRCFGSANYGIFVTVLTGLVVLLFAVAGVPPKDVMAARMINTVAGGVIALTAYGLWPTWERTQTPELMARMLDAYRQYFRAIREAYLNPGVDFGDHLNGTRLEARRARSNLEASIDRLGSEPGTTPDAIAALSNMLASSHRLIHAVMALEAGLTSRSAPPRPAFRPFANDVELTLYYLASALRGSKLERTSAPDLREDHHALIHSAVPGPERYALVNTETDRITNSLNTLREQVLAWLDAPWSRSTV